MKLRIYRVALAAVTLIFGPAGSGASAADDEAGARAFRACAACHSLEPGRHMTGPSLAGLWGQPAGNVAGFTRYSPALKSAAFAWDDQSLQAWLASPGALVPSNFMTFPGIKDRQVRADLIAFLRTNGLEQIAGEPAAPDKRTRGPVLEDLKAVSPGQQVVELRYCGDSYYVTTADGRVTPFWEFNLRFKSDSSEMGPSTGAPVLLPAGMMGDRAYVIFADPAEIGAHVQKQC